MASEENKTQSPYEFLNYIVCNESKHRLKSEHRKAILIYLWTCTSIIYIYIVCQHLICDQKMLDIFAIFAGIPKHLGNHRSLRVLRMQSVWYQMSFPYASNWCKQGGRTTHTHTCNTRSEYQTIQNTYSIYANASNIPAPPNKPYQLLRTVSISEQAMADSAPPPSTSTKCRPHNFCHMSTKMSTHNVCPMSAKCRPHVTQMSTSC